MFVPAASHHRSATPKEHQHIGCSKLFLAVASLLILVGLLLGVFSVAVGLPLILIPGALFLVKGLLLLCFRYIKQRALKEAISTKTCDPSPLPYHRDSQLKAWSTHNSYALDYKGSLTHFWKKQPSLCCSTFVPVDWSAPLHVWKHPYANTTLVATTGDIASPRLRVSRCYRALFVNAANPDIHKNGGGTNKAFTDAVSSNCWDKSKEKKSKLEVGDCTAGEWEDRYHDKKTSFIEQCRKICNREEDKEYNWGYPTHFAQLLGPQAKQCNNNPQSCFESVRKGYLSCFEKARTLSCELVQLPLIASNLYAPPPDHPNHHAWVEAAKAALLSALGEFSILYPNYQLVVVVTNLHIAIFE